MTEKTVRPQSVLRRTMLVGTAGVLGGAVLRPTSAQSQTGTAPAAAVPGSAGNDLLALNGWKGERQQIIVGHGGRGVLRFWPKVGFSNQILRHIDDDPGELWHALVGRPARLFETSAAPQLRLAVYSLTAPGGAAPPRRQLSSRPPRGRACGRIRASRAPARARRGGPSMPKQARQRGLVRSRPSSCRSPS